MSDKGFDIVEVGKKLPEGLKKTFGKKTHFVVGAGVLLAAGFGWWAMRSGSVESSGEYAQDSITTSDPGFPSGSGGVDSSISAADINSMFSDLTGENIALGSLLTSQGNMIEDLQDQIAGMVTTSEGVGVTATTMPVDSGLVAVPTVSPAAAANTYTEGSHIYTNTGTSILKDGNLVDPTNYKYIPTAIGGSRIDPAPTAPRASAPTAPATRTLTEGSNVYTNTGGVISKNGVVVPTANLKYIPASIGGARG